MVSQISSDVAHFSSLTTKTFSETFGNKLKRIGASMEPFVIFELQDYFSFFPAVVAFVQKSHD